jgi:hypothetical protein
MNNEKDSNNVFKFSLKQGNINLCEKIYNADLFNPFTRYSINIKDILPKAITKFQIMLSKKHYDTLLCVGREDLANIEDDEDAYYDLYKYHQDIINSYPNNMRSDMIYSPESITQKIEEKTIRGVEFKIALHINDNPIVERVFYVNGFNTVARWSIDLLELFLEISDSIFEKIKKCDIKNMWDDYTLINQMDYSITQIRELTLIKREELLRKLNKRY